MSAYKIGQSIDDVRAASGNISIHKMSSNENPYGPSPKAITAITEQLSQLHYYPERDDSKITRALAEHFGKGLCAANFTTGNGAVDLINLLESAMFVEGEANSIVICPPCFGSYAATAKLKGATVIEHPLDPQTFAIDSAGLANSITENTRLVYICNPNNPTGSYFDQSALSQILDSLPEHVTLVYDEVYYHFATEFRMPDAIQSVLHKRNIVILHSFSKAYGLAGLRTGYAIASEAIIAKLKKRKLTFQNDRLSMAAMQAALGDKQFLTKIIDNNTQQRTWLRRQLDDLGIQYWPSQANFICFKAPNGKTAQQIIELLLTYGVMVRAAFYLPDCVRVSIGQAEANRQFIKAISEIIDQTSGGTER
ncbi:MAG: histidinol-phosphate transaminase [Pseudomonadales bacterium]|nr:histidinol-phosphate transaminase [Pseudomonadales bacterium]NRA14137.1 histidinol-phosphate transaminase [Oceanospirillaceae bacterium]